MTEKLTLQETIVLLAKNGYPFEVVPGSTLDSIRHHVLVVHESLPEFYLTFGDERHGSLFDSAWVTASMGEKIRIKEMDLRKLIETKASPPKWTRKMPAAPDPVILSLVVINKDLGLIQGSGNFIEKTPIGSRVRLAGFDEVDVTLDVDLDASPGASVYFQGTYRFPHHIDSVKLV